MRAEIKRLHKRLGVTTVYVTHDQIEAMTLADRIVVMKDGNIQQHGTPQQLFEEPANKFVAVFMGMPPMNFLQATLLERDGALYAECENTQFKLPTIKNRDQLPASGEIIIGFRPSALNLAVEDATQNTLHLTINVCEYVGTQSVLISELQGKRVMVEVQSNNAFKLHDIVKFSVKPEAIYVFDGSNEMAIY
jgi:multiple sugar transport system ATP-binding protein